MTSYTLFEPRFPAMPEAHVSALWEEEAIPGRRFTLVGGREMELRSAGAPNEYDGPDYLDACIVLDGAEHRGAIELHTRTSRWQQHGHDGDARYDEVILHVVMFDDRPSGQIAGIPLLVLSDVLLRPFRTAWADVLRHAGREGPSGGTHAALQCESLTMSLPRGIIYAALQLAAARRLGRKLERARSRLDLLARGLSPVDAEAQLLYELAARAMGYGGNEAAMQKLAEAVPLVVPVPLAMPDPLVVPVPFAMPETSGRSVILTVAAGLAPGPPSRQLFPSHTWRSKGITPLNRIPYRLDWLASLAERIADPGWRLDLQRSARQYQATRRGCLQSKQGLRDMAALLGYRAKGRSDRAKENGTRAKENGTRSKENGNRRAAIGDRVTEILINAVAPWLHVRAQRTCDARLNEAAVHLYLNTRPAPQNRITRKLGSEFGCGHSHSSAEQQGMIELYTNYCQARKCSQCLIGRALRLV